MQMPLRNGLMGRVNWRRGIFGGWTVALVAFLFFLFMPQVFAPLIAQLINPVLPQGSFDLVLVLGSAGIFVLMALGLNVVVGFAGLLDLGYAAFFAIGAYSYGTANFGTSTVGGQTLKLAIWPLLLAAPVIAAMFGVILGAPTLRLRGDYLAIVTLGFGEIVPILFQNINSLGGIRLGGSYGFNGLERPATLNLPYISIPFTLSDSANFYYLVFTLVVVATIGLTLLRRSRIGRAWVAIREDETAAACSGVNLVATKLIAFAIGASVSGFAGVLYAAQYGSISPENFGFSISITILVMVVLGGMGSIPGVITGGLLLGLVNRMIVELPAVIQDPDSLLYPLYQHAPNLTQVINQSQALIYGIILLLVILLRPQGLIPSAIRKRELKSEALAVIEKDGTRVVLEVPVAIASSEAGIQELEELELVESDISEESTVKPTSSDVPPSQGRAGGGAAQ
ncbi:MAG TPA: branched-chain amino acid ABC transporter permease [Ktedonobacterales bacterium]|nr:branched-chain amino acid ABC transporter permease [Ktedonobacterales bacterium]